MMGVRPLLWVCVFPRESQNPVRAGWPSSAGCCWLLLLSSISAGRSVMPTLGLLAALILGSSRSGGHVTHLSFYDYVPTEQREFCTEGLRPAAGNNLSSYASDFAQFQFPAILDVENLGGNFNHGMYMRGGLNDTHLNPKWKELVDGVFSTENLKIMGHKKAIRGIFLGDEPCCGGLPVTELAELATYIKGKLVGTGVWLYVNECERSFTGLSPGSDGCPKDKKGFCRYAGQIRKVPDAIDFISADIYELNSAHEPIAARAVYEKHIYPALAPHQKTWVVPGAFAPLDVDNATNSKTMVAKLEGYWSWAQADIKVVGINPWHYNTWGSFDGTSPFKLGAREFPAVRAKLAQIGAVVRRNHEERQPKPVPGGYGGLGRIRMAIRGR
jgi:hypothetical protein